MTDEFVDEVERPEDSKYYNVRHEQLEELPEHERKIGPPSPTPDHDREVGG